MGELARNLPNLITLMRLVLVVPVVYCLLDGDYKTALLLFFIAGASDALDGYLARRFGWFSRFGAIADPLADKLLLVSAFVTLTYTGIIPVWLLVVVMARDVVILTGALTYHYTLGAYDMQPTRLGKLSTFTQIVYVLALICQLAGLAMPGWIRIEGAWIVATMAFTSGGHYVWVWGGRFVRKLQEQRSS